jgi:hypothetical protein
MFRNGVMSPALFWTLVLANVSLNGCHVLLLSWADYPRAEDTARMGGLARQVAQESGITDVSFVSFVNVVSLKG